MADKFKFSTPIPVRMPETTLADLAEVSKTLSLSQQDVIRLALGVGVAALKKLKSREIHERLFELAEEKKRGRG